MSLAKAAVEVDLVLYCMSGWFSVYVCVCAYAWKMGEDETVCMVWKRWGGVWALGPS